MKLSELVTEDIILPELVSTDISGVLHEFSHAICVAGKYRDEELLYQRLYEREKQESTGIGNGLAIPHCKIEQLDQGILSIGYSSEGVDFKSIDGKPTLFFFVVVSPAASSVMHLRSLAALSRLLRSQRFLSHLREKPGKSELIALLKQEEEEARVMP